MTLAPGTDFVGFTPTQAITDLEVYVYQWPAGFEPVVTSLHLAAPAVVSGVPEPASWALMLGGFGLVGSALRRKKGTASFA